MTSNPNPGPDWLLIGSPLRRPGTSKNICMTLVVVLGFAALVNLGLVAGLRSDMLAVFDRALARSTALVSIPLAFLRFSTAANASSCCSLPRSCGAG